MRNSGREGNRARLGSRRAGTLRDLSSSSCGAPTELRPRPLGTRPEGWAGFAADYCWKIMMYGSEVLWLVQALLVGAIATQLRSAGSPTSKPP